MPKVKTCLQCGGSMEGKLPKAKYCSSACANKYHRNKRAGKKPTASRPNMPVQINFCFNCGMPQPKEVKL